MREGKIGPSEGFFAVANAVICIELFSRTSNITELGNTMWYSVLASAAIGALLFGMTLWLMNIARADSLEHALSAANKPLAVVTLCVIALIFFVAGTSLTARFSILVKEYVFLNTPATTLLVAILGVVFYLAFLGLETVTRCSKLFFIILAASFVLLGLCTYKWFNASTLYPLGGGGFAKVAQNSLQRSVSFLPVCALAIFGTNLHGRRYAAKAGFKALICGGLICSVILLGISTIFSFEYMGSMETPLLRLASITVLGSYYQRLNDAFVFIWLSSTMVCASFLMYTAANILCRVIKTKRLRLVLMCLAPIALGGGFLLNENIPGAREVVDFLVSYSWLMMFALFALALLFALAKKKKEAKNEQSKPF